MVANSDKRRDATRPRSGPGPGFGTGDQVIKARARMRTRLLHEAVSVLQQQISPKYPRLSLLGDNSEGRFTAGPATIHYLIYTVEFVACGLSRLASE